MARVDYIDEPDAPKANRVVPSVVAIVQDDEDCILLIHKTDNDLWALPGGGHEIGENIERTVVREVEEETGYVVKVDRVTGLYTNPRHVMKYDDGEVRQQFSIAFRAHVVGGTVRRSLESKDVQWIAISDLKGLPMHPSMRDRIAHALSNRPSPYIG